MASLNYVTCPLLTGVSLLTGCLYLRIARKKAFGNLPILTGQLLGYAGRIGGRHEFEERTRKMQTAASELG